MRLPDPAECLHKLTTSPGWTATETFDRTRYVCDASPLDPDGPGLVEWDGEHWTRERCSPAIRLDGLDGAVQAVRETPCPPSASEYVGVDLKKGIGCFYAGSAGNVIWLFEAYEHRTGTTPALALGCDPVHTFSLTAMTTEAVQPEWIAERFVARASQFLNRELRASVGPVLQFPPPVPAPVEISVQTTMAGALAALYRSDLYQCKQCGVRLPQELVDAHLDAHFARNRARKVRQWFPEVHEFTNAPAPVRARVVEKSTIRCIVCDRGFEPVYFEDDWVYPDTTTWRGLAIHSECAQYV